MIVISLILLFFSVVKFKEAVFFNAATLIFMNNLMSGIPGVKLFYLIALFQIVYFCFFVKKQHDKKNKIPIAIISLLILTMLEYIVSDLSSGRWYYLHETIVFSIAYLFFPFVFWNMLETRDDIILYGRFLLYFFLIVVVYALFEAVTGNNIIAQWANQSGVMVGEGGIGYTERFGLKRCNSILPWCSALGMNSALIFSVLILLNAIGFKFQKWEYLMIFLLPFAVLLSGTRAQFIVFAICILGLLPLFLNKHSKYFRHFMLYGLIVLITALPFFSLIVDSILHTDKIGGSNENMRLVQLEITLDYLKQSPLFGNGKRFVMEVACPNNMLLYGAESIVFSQLIERGILGLTSYYLIAIFLSIWCFKYYKELAILPVAYVCGKTMGTVIGVEYVIPLILCFFCVKAKMLNNMIHGKYNEQYIVRS